MAGERTGMFMQDHSNKILEQLKLMLEPHPYTETSSVHQNIFFF